MANFANTRVIASRVFKLGNRADGSTRCRGKLTLVAGVAENIVWIDGTAWNGDQWLDSVEGLSVDDDSLVISDSDVNRELAVIGLDATTAIAGTTLNLTGILQPGGTPFLLEVNVVENA